MNLLDLGDPLINVFKQLRQADVYTFALTCKRAKRIATAYARRPDICKYMAFRPFTEHCFTHGHVLCVLINKKLINGDAILDLFYGYRTRKWENKIKGIKLIITLFPPLFYKYVCKWIEQITLNVLNSSDTTIWNLIDFNQNDLISKVREIISDDFVMGVRIGSVTALMRKWELDNKEKSSLLYLASSGKYRQALIEVPGLCHTKTPNTNSFIKNIEWYICSNCGKAVGEHTH